MLNLVPLRWIMWNITTDPGKQYNGGLKTNWRDEWAAAQKHYAPMISNDSAQGFMLGAPINYRIHDIVKHLLSTACPSQRQLIVSTCGFEPAGDELVWQECTVEAVALLAEAVRADFPTAPIYYNENVPVVLHGRNRGGHAVNFSVPPALTWFSFDYYHFNGKDEGVHVNTVRTVYKEHVYTKLLPHQQVLLVPGAFAVPAGAAIPGGFKCNESCFDAMGADDAAHYWTWAHEDTRVVGLAV